MAKRIAKEEKKKTEALDEQNASSSVSAAPPPAALAAASAEASKPAPAPVIPSAPESASLPTAVPSVVESETAAAKEVGISISASQRQQDADDAADEEKPDGDKKKKAEKLKRPSRPAKTMTETVRDKKEKLKVSGSKFLNITPREKIMFAKHLSVMLESGIPLREALEVMSGQVSSKPMERMLTVMIRDLSEGFTLSSSLEKFPRVFKPFSVNIIRVGESSGTLPNALSYQAIQLEKAHDLQGKIRGAMLYPIIIFVGAIGIACYLSFYILPKLVPMFGSLNVKLPATTRTLLAVSAFIVHQWPLLLGVTASVVIGIALLYRIPAVKYFLHATSLRLPLFGGLIRTIQIAFFTRILGILLTSGVQIVQAIGVTAESESNLVYQKRLREVAKQVERGEAITDELDKHSDLFPKITVGMIKVGDRTGRLAESLMTAAEFSEKEVDDLTKNLSTMIEPVTLLLVGGMVGFIALSIITPIYSITSGFGGGK